MLRTFLPRRGSLPRRLQATSVGQSSLVKKLSTFSTSPPTQNNQLDLWSARSWVEKVAPALQTYLTLEKHLLIPRQFVVPPGDPKWDVEAWNYPLGQHCWNLRALKQQDKELPFFALDDLETLDFPWDLQQYTWELLVLPCLKKFHEIQGHCDVSGTFVVPEDDPQWPKMLWGFRLGRTVRSMIYSGKYKAQLKDYKTELEEIGFAAVSFKQRHWDRKIMPALVTFRREFGHCNVHFYFVVPEDDKWPKETWGLRLGATVANMRSNGNYEAMARRDEHKLEEIGFVWDPQGQRWTEIVLPALEMYRAVCKSRWIPIKFVVPAEEAWPEKLHGLRLGNIFMKIRHTRSYSFYVDRDRARLEALGYDFKAPYNPSREAPLLAKEKLLAQVKAAK